MESSLDGDVPLSILLSIGEIGASSVILYCVSLLLLFVSALVSGAEVAFFSLSPSQVEGLKESKERSSSRILHLLDTPKHLLATILILNNLVNVGIVTLTTFATWQIFGKENILSIVILTVLSTVAIVFFGEIVPKVLATQKNLAFARFTLNFLQLSKKTLYPFVWLLLQLSKRIEKKAENNGYNLSADELNEAVEITSTKEVTEEEKEILKGIASFGTKTVKQVMKSRMDIIAFDIEFDFHELMDRVNKSGFSRVPIYHETIDQLKGILYIKDLIPFINRDEKFKWQSLIRKNIFFVPESKKIDELLRDFQKKRVHIAIVVDEYGGTSGLITMEDIIEEIVGEINDEFDQDELSYKKIDSSRYIFEGKTTLTDFCKTLNLNTEIFDDAKGESESLGGLLLELFGKMPSSGEEIEHSNIQFTVVSVNQKRIKSVKVQVKPTK